MDPWIAEHAGRIAARAERELQALVSVSSPSGDEHGAQEAVALCVALAPDAAKVRRLPCSSPGLADDVLLTVAGTGGARILLLGHLDTVVAHDEHRALAPDPQDADRLVGSGSIDMKGGDVLALGVLRALAEEPASFAELALLLVCDEEWRTADFRHGERFAGWDACLCFEAGELDAQGRDAVVVRRKAAGSILVTATGRSAHSGSKPDEGVNALLALAAAAQAVAARHDPDGPAHLTAVPTILHAGTALNVVPAHGELTCDVRADHLDAVESVLDAVPAEVGGARLHARNLRRWPGMDAREAIGPVLTRAAELLGRPVVPASRGGASDASHLAVHVPLTIDGLGPLGGDAHAPTEWVSRASLRSRAEVALAVARATVELKSS